MSEPEKDPFKAQADQAVDKMDKAKATSRSDLQVSREIELMHRRLQNAVCVRTHVRLVNDLSTSMNAQARALSFHDVEVAFFVLPNVGCRCVAYTGAMTSCSTVVRQLFACQFVKNNDVNEETVVSVVKQIMPRNLRLLTEGNYPQPPSPFPILHSLRFSRSRTCPIIVLTTLNPSHLNYLSQTRFRNL
jgi:hypothetical protein